MQDLIYPKFGAVRVDCHPAIANPSHNALVLIINNYTTALDMISMVLSRLEPPDVNPMDFCVVMENGYKGKEGEIQSCVLQDEDYPLTMQDNKPKGQTRFSVQPRSGVVLKLYDSRIWPTVVFGDVYITADFSVQQVLHHLLSSTVSKKRLVKLTLALGNSRGKIYAYLSDTEKPLRALNECHQINSEAVCLLITKRPKIKPKQPRQIQSMFRSQSWASLNVRDPVIKGDKKAKTDQGSTKEKHRKFRVQLRKKRGESKIHPKEPASQENGDINQTPESVRTTSLSKEHRKFISRSHNDLLDIDTSNQSSSTTTCPVAVKSDSPLSSGVRTIEKKTLTSFYSVDNLSFVPHEDSDSDSEISSTDPLDDYQTVEFNSSTVKMRNPSKEPTYSQMSQRAKSLGDLSMRQQQPLMVAPTEPTIYDSWHDVNDLKKNHIYSYPQTAAKCHNNNKVESMNHFSQNGFYKKNNVVTDYNTNNRSNKQQARFNRRSCVARITNGSEHFGSQFHEEDPDRYDFLDDSLSNLQKVPRQRRSLPQIPSNSDIDEKKKRFAELMLRRLTVCSENGEEFVESVSRNSDPAMVYAYDSPRRITNEMGQFRPVQPVHSALKPSKSAPLSQCGNWSSPIVSYRPDYDPSSPESLKKHQYRTNTPHSKVVSRTALNGSSNKSDANNFSPRNGKFSCSMENVTGTYSSPYSKVEYRQSTNSHILHIVNSPSKTGSDNGSDHSVSHANISHSSMLDSGYCTNGESDSNSLPKRYLQLSLPKGQHEEQKVSSNVRTLTNGHSKSQPDLKRLSGDYSSSSPDQSWSPDSNKLTFAQQFEPTLFQILTMCTIHAVKLLVPGDKALEECLHFRETRLCLPCPKNGESSSETDKTRITSPKGFCARGMGGPGSAFRRIQTATKDKIVYSLVAFESVADDMQSHPGQFVIERGDILIEVNGNQVMSLPLLTVQNLVCSQQGTDIDIVVARRQKTVERDETLTTEISKLRQQCSYLISEVKNKEQVITDLAHRPREVTPPPPPLPQSKPPKKMKETIRLKSYGDGGSFINSDYETCDLSDDEFIV